MKLKIFLHNFLFLERILFFPQVTHFKEKSGLLNSVAKNPSLASLNGFGFTFQSFDEIKETFSNITSRVMIKKRYELLIF